MPGARRSLVVVTVALAASLAANALLFASGERERRDENAVRLDPAGLRVYRDAPLPPAGRPVLVLFGDSRAAMWTPPSLPEFEVVDRGVGNQTTAQVLLRIDADVKPLRPAVVVLEAGVNDLKTIPQFPDRRAEIVAACEANLRTIVEELSGDGGTVVLTTVFAIGDVPLWRKPFWSDDVASAVREVNAFLGTLATGRVVLFDADRVLDDANGKIKPNFQFDYLHLVPAGYAALNDALVPLVKTLAQR
jgi:lysophospholipase L1-like esterase